MTHPVTAFQVHIDQEGKTVPVGTAFVTVRRNVTTTNFHYTDDYLGRPQAWEISPDLPLPYAGATTTGLPGAMADSAPDRWGRNLIHKRLHAGPPGTARPTVTEVDCLLGVSDGSRQGALRYTVGDDPTFLAESSDVPKVIELPRLLHAARQVERDDEDSEAVKALLDAGSGSLGGTRPKASVRDEGRLFIAKFPHASDEWDVMAWEATALDLAAASGVTTPPHRLVRLGADGVLLLERFDRTGNKRIGYISAMTLVGGHDGHTADYLEVAEAIADHGSNVRDDLRQLWRRIAVSVALNNTDDHLRNHGFLRAPGGWALAPAFDVNPNPNPSTGRVTGIAGTIARREARDALFDAAEYFDLRTDDATRIWEEVRDAVAKWRDVAASHGVSDSETRRFESVLDRH